MKRKHFILAFVAMLMSFSFSAYADDVIVVNSWAELKAALEASDDVQRSAARQRSTAMRTVSTASEETTEETKTPIPNTPYYYEDFQTTKIQLGKNVVYDDALPIAKSNGTTLDLNGHKVLGSESAEHAYPFYNYGKFLVVDNSEAGTGAIYCGVKTGIKEDGVSINEEAVFVMTGGNIICTHDNEDDAAVANYGIAYITGGTIEGANNAVLNQDGATMHILAGVLISGDVVGTGITAADGVYTVAQIGTTKYGTLQAAIDAAVDGDVITLVTDASGDVTVTQAPDVKFIIDGNDKKFTGTITVDGKSARYETAGLTIKNVNFDATAGISADACINLGAEGNNNTRYTNNVTVENCTFTDDDYAAVAIKSYTGGDYNVQIIDCTAEGMHSLAQLANVEKGLVISGNTVNTKNGINLNQTYAATIEGNTINVKGYAVRIGSTTGGNITLTNNSLKTDNTEGDPAIELRGTVEALNMTKNVVSGDTHIKGTATTIAVDANYWDGDNAPRVGSTDTPISVNSYYADEALTDLQRNASGSINAFVKSDRIFGDVTSNAANSIVIEVIGADGNVIGKVESEKAENLIGTTKTLTWRINLGTDDSGSWAMTWNEGAPSVNNLPAKVKLYVDGVDKGEATVKFTANGDGASPVFAAKTDADGKILSFIACEGKYNLDNAADVLVASAVADGNLAILTAGTYKVPTGKNLTITGAVDGVVFDNIGDCNMGGANVTFNSVTFDYYPNATYTGLQHSGNLVYNNCTINGQVFLYGQSETFNNCTFNQESADAYNVWTYGAKEVAFNECTFNSAGKSVLVYIEDENYTNDIAFTECELIASQTVDGKAAIEMDASRQTNGGITVTVDAATTATGFSENTKSGSSLWHDKKVEEGKYNGGTNTEVTVAGVVVKEAAARGLAGEGTAESPYLISNLAKLMWFAEDVIAGDNYAGKFVKLTADIDLNSEPWTPMTTFNGTFDGNSKTISNLVVNGEGKSNQGFFGQTNNGEIKNLTINNAKVTGRLSVGVVAGTPFTSKYTDIKVTGHVEVNGMAYVGGVGGKNAYANWTNITVDVDADSYVAANSVENGTAYRTYVGGVIGFNGEGGHTFKNISSNIKVIGSTQDIGGIFGILHYNNNAEDITFTGSVEAPADATEVGAIAGVWHNQKGTDVEINNIVSEGSVKVGDTVVEGAVIGGAYKPENVTPSTSGSLKIDGEEMWLSVAKIGDTTYRTVADALAAAQGGETVTLLWNEGDPAIAMNGAVYGKNVTITGTATVDWDKNYLFVGRGGEGNGTVTFDGANLTSASNSASFGIHVSGREKGTDNKYDGTLVIKNSTIDLDYLINKGTMSLDNSTLTVKNGFSIGGRPASETENGEDATATIDLANNSKVIVNDHNGMGLGYEDIGVMNIDATSTFETTQAFLVTAKGTMNVNGKASVAGTLTNNGTINLTAKGATLATPTADLTVNTDVADYKVAYIDGVYKLVEKDYIAQVGDQKFEVFADALDAVENGGTIILVENAVGDEKSTEIKFTKDIEFTITGNAPEYVLPTVTFLNATVNIKDATIKVLELDARQDAVINVDNSTVYSTGSPIVKSYYNGAINIKNKSKVYTHQLTTMGYINVDGTSLLNATWQTNVLGNGMITLDPGATFNTAALQLTGKDYSGRDNTDADRVGKPATIVVDGANFTAGKVYSASGADYSYETDQYGINVGTIDGKSAILDIKNGAVVNMYVNDGHTVNFGAGATVNVDASTLNVLCRAENGTVTLANAGTVYVSGASNLAAAKVTGAGWFYMNGVSLDTDTKLIGAKVRFASGENTVDGATIDDGFFQVGIGAYNGVDDNVDTENGVVVNVKNNAKIGSNGDTYAGWVGTGFYDTDAEKAAVMTDAKYVLNIDNSIAEFGYLHVSNDGELNVNGVPANKANYNNSEYAFYAGDFIINGTANFTDTDVLALYTKVSCDNGTTTPGTLNINAGTEYEAERHNDAVEGTNFILYKTGVVNVAEGADLQACEYSSIAADAELNIAGNVTAKGDITNSGTINFTGMKATLAAQEGLTINHNFEGGYTVEHINGVYKISHYVASVDGVNYESLEAALEALTDGATLTLLEDITVTELWDCRNNGAKVTAANVTIDGNGNTLTLTGAVEDKNWNTVFRFEGDNATVKKLTIDASEATGIVRGISSKLSITVDNCTFIGNGTTAKRAIIFGEGAGDAIADVVATVTNSTFRNWSYGVSDNQSGKDAKSVTVSGNTFKNASVLVSANETVTFDKNTLVGGYVNITSYTNKAGLSVHATENTLDAEQVNQITVNPSGIYAQGGFSIPVAEVGGAYCLTLAGAISKANGATVTVLDDIILSEAVEVTTAAVLNLNGNSITPATDATMTGGLFRLLEGADLTITGEGEISNNGNQNVYAAVGVLGNNAKLTVNGGNLTGYYYGIAGNGYKTDTQVTINGGVIAGSSTGSLGIYHPQNGTLTVTGGEITGATGIYFKGGKLDIQGGTIKGTGDAVDYVYNGSGCEATGDALVIENAAANGYAAIESVSITGGTFISTNAAPIASYAPEASDALVEFIGEESEAAQFNNNNIDESLLAIGYQLKDEDGDGYYGVKYTNHRESMTIVDGAYDEFVNEKEITVGTLTYERTLMKSGVWQSLYVPFEIPVEALTALGYEAAFFYDVHFDVLAGGEIDPESAPEVHLIKIKQGTLRANFPYVIRANAGADLNLSLVLKNTTLFTTAEDKMNSVESGSTINRFIFEGTYKKANPAELTGDADVPCYAITNSGIFANVPASASVSEFRVYMKIIAKDGSPVILNDVAAESIKMRAIGEENEDGTTTIYDMEADEQSTDYIYDLQGRRVLEPQKGGLYIVNGKKVIF